MRSGEDSGQQQALRFTRLFGEGDCASSGSLLLICLRGRHFSKGGRRSQFRKCRRKISFTQIDSHVWSNGSEYAHAKAALEKLGFQRSPVLVASPQKWVVEFWLSQETGLFGAILDSPPTGIHTEFMVSYNDGSTVSFENTDECGRRHLENHNWLHCGKVGPDQLLQRALRERQPSHVGQICLSASVQSYERAINESLAWRRNVGFTPAEMKHTYERQRRARSVFGRLT